MNDEKETPKAAVRRNVRRLKTEGLDAATDAAIALLKDDKAPAQAKSAAINAVYRAAGLMDRNEHVEDENSLSQMTLEELARKREILRQIENDHFGDNDDSVFD